MENTDTTNEQGLVKPDVYNGEDTKSAFAVRRLTYGLSSVKMLRLFPFL